MRLLKHLFEKNQAWAGQVTQSDPDFFHRLSQIQAPKYLWIGCADSRVPANQIVGLDPANCLSTAMWPTWWCTPT